MGFVLCLLLSLFCSFSAGAFFLDHRQNKVQGAKSSSIKASISGVIFSGVTIFLYFTKS